MGKRFKHLSYTDRLVIERLYNRGVAVMEIAERLGFCFSTIYKELKRGYYDFDYGLSQRYSADIAQDDYERKEQKKGKPLKIANDIHLANYIENKILNEKYSPEAVLLHLLQRDGYIPFCKTTLYSYIDKGIFLYLTNNDLISKTKRKRKYNRVRPCRPPKGLSIEKRPQHVLNRNEFGHWEMDCVTGRSKGKNQSLLVLSERKTRYELIYKLPDRTTNSIIKTLSKIEKEYNFKSVFKSITVDNGSEFQDVKGMEYSKGKKRTTIYYCHPFCSCERGTNENINKMIRRFFPKGMSLSKINNNDCLRVQEYINNYPRKILGNMTAKQVFDCELRQIS